MEVAGKAVAATAEVMAVVGMEVAAKAVAMAAGVMAAAGRAEGTAEVARVAAAKEEAMVGATAGAAKEAVREECRRPRPHNSERPNVHTPPGSRRSGGCCPSPQRAARRVTRGRTPPTSRSSCHRDYIRCCEPPSARWPCTIEPHTAHNAGTPGARSRCTDSRPLTHRSFRRRRIRA